MNNLTLNSFSKVLSLVALFTCIQLFQACKSEPKFNASLLTGSWSGIDWKVKGKSSGRDASSVNFVFAPASEDGSAGTYMASYGSQKESGNYTLDSDKLYTTAEDNIEKVVRVIQLNRDTLILGMNRMGQEEELVLVIQQQ
ncbi:MAG: lipocalin family protein [Saprospiraceae bacterium]